MISDKDDSFPVLKMFFSYVQVSIVQRIHTSVYLYICTIVCCPFIQIKPRSKLKTHNLSVILVQDVIAKQSERNVILFIHIRQSYTFDLLSVLNEIGWLSRPHVLIRDTNKHETYWACWDPKNPPSVNSGKK